MTFGNNADVSMNGVCLALGMMTDGGWYLCPTKMFGITFGVYSTSTYVVSFMEIKAYSEEAIQIKASNTVSFEGTNLAGYPASNALQNIV